jgi:hypothetical protein
MERIGLEFPNDMKKFTEIIEKNFFENGTLSQFFDALARAFPEKKEDIINVPIHVNDDRNCK